MTFRLSAAFALMISIISFSVTSAQTLSSGGGDAKLPGPYNPPVGGPETINYVHDDGTIDDSIGVQGGAAPFDIIWLNTFARRPGGEVITQLQAAFGQPGDTRPYDGLPATILLYDDPDGGSVRNATRVQSFTTTIANANTGIFNTYDIPDTLVSNQFLVGALVRNLPQGNGFVAAYDDTPSHVPNVSYVGFMVNSAINENNLASIPTGQFGLIEALVEPGNWALRATGETVPEPSGIALLGFIGASLVRRRHRSVNLGKQACHWQKCS